jgi:hypothetical protein
MRRSLLAVAAVATVAFALSLVLSFSKSGHHRTGTNGVARQTIVSAPAGKELCQAGEYFERGTGRVRFFPDEHGGVVGPFEVTVLWDDGKRRERGTVAARDYERSEAAAVAIPELESAHPDGVVCIANRGAAGAGFYGDFIPVQAGSATQVPVPKQAPPPFIRMHLDYQAPEASTWWSFAGTIADRFGLVKATFFGAWTFWVALIALLALGFGSVWYAARELAR